MDWISLDPSSTVLSELSPSTLSGSPPSASTPTSHGTDSDRKIVGLFHLPFAPSPTDSAQPSSGGKAVALATSTTVSRAASKHQLAVAADGSLTASCPCNPRGFVISDLARSSPATSLGDCNRCPSIVAPHLRIDASQEIADWTRVVREQQCTVHRQPARVQRILSVRSRARLSRGGFRSWCFGVTAHPLAPSSAPRLESLGRVTVSSISSRFGSAPISNWSCAHLRKHRPLARTRGLLSAALSSTRDGRLVGASVVGLLSVRRRCRVAGSGDQDEREV